MINNVKLFFINYHFTSSLVKCLLESFAHFLNRVFIFLSLNFEKSLHILDIVPLSNIYLAKIYPHYNLLSYNLVKPTY